jgi:hypothetical protein
MGCLFINTISVSGNFEFQISAISNLNIPEIPLSLIENEFAFGGPRETRAGLSASTGHAPPISVSATIPGRTN